jgi:glycosyltransferase involved in cell wall biosynthesis
MRVGVVIPSRLAPRPGGRILVEFGPELWLDGALASVQSQTLYNPATWEIYVGISPGTPAPLHAYDYAHVIKADRPGQAAAVNAAADVAALSSDVLLFLDDDDRWHAKKAAVQLPMLETHPFVSCSQRLVDVAGNVVGVNDYPVPSSWAMRADVWSRVGGFNTGLKWMVDSEWLGRLNERKIRRAHLVGARTPGDASVPRKVGYIARCAEIVTHNKEFLVDRTNNPAGGMATIGWDFVAGQEADAEAEGIRKRFGGDPW